MACQPSVTSDSSVAMFLIRIRWRSRSSLSSLMMPAFGLADDVVDEGLVHRPGVDLALDRLDRTIVEPERLGDEVGRPRRDPGLARRGKRCVVGVGEKRVDRARHVLRRRRGGSRSSPRRRGRRSRSRRWRRNCRRWDRLRAARSSPARRRLRRRLRRPGLLVPEASGALRHSRPWPAQWIGPHHEIRRPVRSPAVRAGSAVPARAARPTPIQVLRRVVTISLLERGSRPRCGSERKRTTHCRSNRDCLDGHIIFTWHYLISIPM